jgi:hypothetical protein
MNSVGLFSNLFFMFFMDFMVCIFKRINAKTPESKDAEKNFDLRMRNND